jgi:transcription antitermination factor NusG
MARQWFIGVTKQSRETFAKLHLEKQNFNTYLPMCISEWAKKPKIKPFLPSYIFISLDPICDRWRAVFSTFGMRSVLCSGEHPQPAPQWIIDGIKEREVDGLVRLPPKVACKFKKGDHIAIKGSPIDCLFEEVVDYRRAKVFYSLLGRPHHLILPLSRLSAASLPGAVAVA